MLFELLLLTRRLLDTATPPVEALPTPARAAARAAALTVAGRYGFCNPRVNAETRLQQIPTFACSDALVSAVDSLGITAKYRCIASERGFKALEQRFPHAHPESLAGMRTLPRWFIGGRSTSSSHARLSRNLGSDVMHRVDGLLESHRSPLCPGHVKGYRIKARTNHAER